jgi:hypothetical protein
VEGSLTPGSNLKLSTEDKERLSRILCDATLDLEAQHRPYIDSIDKLWKFYWAVPQHETRNTPWPNASNVVYPLIQLHSDAIKARLKNTIFATHPDLVLGRTGNEELRSLAQKRADFFNWAADDNEFDLLTPVGDWIDEMVPIGSSILFLTWTERFRHIFLPGAGKATPTKVDMGRGPVLSRTPREQVLWSIHKPIQDSELVVRQSLKSRYDLQLMFQLGQIDMDQEDFEHLLVHTSDGGYTKALQDARREQDNLGYHYDDNLYDIREAWVDVPLLRANRLTDDPTAPILPILVWFERNSGTILRAMAKPYLTRGVPAYELHFRTAGSRKNPSGIARRLEHLQRAITTMYNQAIDAVTLANSVNGITSNSRLLNQRFSPGKFLYSDNPTADFAPITLSKIITPDVALIQMGLATAERATGISDPLFGRETRHGGHPSPAASTAMLLQESREMFRDTLRGVRTQFNRLAQDTMLLYRQFGPPDPDRLAASLGGEDAAEILASFDPDAPPYLEESFNLRIASETLNQDQEFQNALTLLQGQMSYGSQVLNTLTLAIQAAEKAPPLLGAAIQHIERLTLAWGRVLEAGREDELKRFLFNFREGNSDAIREFGAYAQDVLRGLAGSQGQPSLPPAPEAPIAPAVGSNGAGVFPGI